MGMANPYYGGNYDGPDGFVRCAECGDIINERRYLNGKLVYKKCKEKEEAINELYLFP